MVKDLFTGSCIFLSLWIYLYEFPESCAQRRKHDLYNQQILMAQVKNSEPCDDNLYCHKYSTTRRSCPKDNSGEDEIKPAFEGLNTLRANKEYQQGAHDKRRRNNTNKVTALLIAHQIDVDVVKPIGMGMAT